MAVFADMLLVVNEKDGVWNITAVICAAENFLAKLTSYIYISENISN